MDDYSITSLNESNNEYCALLVNILAPLIIDGIKSILKEAIKICEENDEQTKYLMTFQNFIQRVPKWNESMISEEKNRIITKSGCNYLEDLITCVHIIKLKALTCVRVGQSQKKIDVDIPSIDLFIHKCYINSARKLYQSVYLFEKDIPSLQIQKNNRELEIIVKECILHTIRDNIPVEQLLRAYLDETQETDFEIDEIVTDASDNVINTIDKPENAADKTVENSASNNTADKMADIAANKMAEKPKETDLTIVKSNSEPIILKIDPVLPTSLPQPIKPPSPTQKPPSIQFDNNDYAISSDGKKSIIDAPKNIAHLESLKHTDYNAGDDDDDDKLVIGPEVSMSEFDMDIVEL